MASKLSRIMPYVVGLFAGQLLGLSPGTTQVLRDVIVVLLN